MSNNDYTQAFDQRSPEHSLSARFYKDADFYQHDLNQVFYKSWIFIGHPADVPNEGDFMCARLGEHSILILRHPNGFIQAYHNRLNNDNDGPLFVTQHKGNCRTTLVDHLKADDPFNHIETLLKPIASEHVCGYIFVCLNDDLQPDFETFKNTVEPYMQWHQVDQLKLAAESSIVEKGNWKLVMENNRECYHCSSNHPELIITLPEKPQLSGVDFTDVDPEIHELWAHCRERKIPGDFHIANDGTYRITRLPLIKDYTSYTMHGYDAVKKRIDGLQDEHIGALIMFHYPNNWNHFLCDHVLSFRVLPLGPQETLVTTKWLVHKEAIEGVDYDLKELQHVWNITNAQDRHLVEQNQIGINSPAYEPGPYSVVQESGVIQFIDWYANTAQKRSNGE